MALKNNSINNNYEPSKSQLSYEETPKRNSDLNNFPNEKTFNKLRDLQLLIKKESALKELCKNKQY